MLFITNKYKYSKSRDKKLYLFLISVSLDYCVENNRLKEKLRLRWSSSKRKSFWIYYQYDNFEYNWLFDLDFNIIAYCRCFWKQKDKCSKSFSAAIFCNLRNIKVRDKIIYLSKNYINYKEVANARVSGTKVNKNPVWGQKSSKLAPLSFSNFVRPKTWLSSKGNTSSLK